MRREGWEARLALVVEAARQRPYALGSWDCFSMACATLEALTGEDRWPEFAGRYSTQREALHLIAQHGSTFEAAFDWFFSAAHVNARQASRGDIVALKGEDGQKHLGVCLGVSSAFLAPQGLVYVPTLSALCAWRI